MNPNVDALLLNNVVDSLKSGTSEAVTSTCEFLETVVIYDFTAEVFLRHKELIMCLLTLCQDADTDTGNAACSCVDAICQRIILEVKRKQKPSWLPISKLVSESDSARERGDGVEQEVLTLSNLALNIAKAAHQIILNSRLPFDKVFRLLVSASDLSTAAQCTAENLELCQVLASVSVALRAASRQNFASFLLLLVKSVQNCPVASLSNDVIYEVYNGLLDASIVHYHPELLSPCLIVLQENVSLNDKYRKASELFVAFRNLGKFLKNSHQQRDDLVPVVKLLKLDDELAESLLPCVFNHLKEYGGKPAIAMTLLLLSEQEPIPRKVYQHLTEIASPLKSQTIGPHIAELFVDESVVRAIRDGMCSDNDQISPNAEKILSLILKGRTWMTEDQWQALLGSIVPVLLLSLESDLQRFKVLGPLLWDLIQQPLISPSDSPSNQLDVNFVLRFLIRNLSRQDVQRDKSSLSLTSALCQQPEAHQLRPRLSVLDPASLSRAFQGDLTLTLASTAKFDVPTLIEALDALKDADLINARTYLVKLAIILEDENLHRTLLENDGLTMLLSYLNKSLALDDTEPCLEAMSSIVKALLHLAHSDATVLRQLASDNLLLLYLLRVTILTGEDIISRRHCVALLQLLSKENERPPSGVETRPFVAPPDWAELWAKAAVKWSCKFVFNSELATPPLMHGNVPCFLKLSPAELELGMAANDCALAERALVRISQANEHRDVDQALSSLREVLQRPNLSPEVFNLEWHEALETFFTVLPESLKDEEIMAFILQTLMLGFKAIQRMGNAQHSPSVLLWLRELITDERHVFWTLFRDQCQLSKRNAGHAHLWPALVRFVPAAVRLIDSGSLAHILRILGETFEQEDQSLVYQLNSLKLVLDCLLQTTAAIWQRGSDAVDPSVIANLVRHSTATVASFSSRNHSNKGRSVVQCCAQLISLLISLSRRCSSAVPLPSVEWLTVLLQHADPVVKTGGLHACLQLCHGAHLTDQLAEACLALLFDPDECCTVVEQAALLLSQHARQMTDQGVRQVCLIASSALIGANQPLLAVLCQLLVNCLHGNNTKPAHLSAITSDFVPMVPRILADADTQADVKAILFCLLYRTSCLQDIFLPWLLKQSESIACAARSLRSDAEHLVGEAAIFLSYLIRAEKEGKVLLAVLKTAPQLWDVLSHLAGMTMDNPAAPRILLFLQTVLTGAVDRGVAPESLDLDPALVETVGRWLLANLPAKTDNSLRQSALQVLGALLLCCPKLTDELIKLTSDFVVKELQLYTQRHGDRSFMSVVRLAHNAVLRHPDAERRLLQRGCPNLLIDIWKKSRTGRGGDSAIAIQRCLIDFEKLLVGHETAKEVRLLLKLVLEYLEEIEGTLLRQLTLIDDSTWSLVESIHELLLASVPSLECRRLLAKYKCWSILAQTWHPVHLKRIINRQQHWVLSSLNALRARLLSHLTYYSEPILPELVDSRSIQTLCDLASQPTAVDRNILDVLRNMSFHASYRNALLASSCVLPLFVRLVTSRSDEEASTKAVGALISLASNNQRVKSDLRAMLDVWFRRNPTVVNKDASQFTSLCATLQRLIDV